MSDVHRAKPEGPAYRFVILSEQSESKDLRTNPMLCMSMVRRAFDFVLRPSLRMTSRERLRLRFAVGDIGTGRRGGAPRSESKNPMIAGGNHTLIQMPPALQIKKFAITANTIKIAVLVTKPLS